MKQIYFIIILLASAFCLGQSNYKDSMAVVRILHEAYTFSESSYLDSIERSQLIHLNYFPIDSSMVITADFKKKRGKKFEIPTSAGRVKIFRQYGILSFRIKDSSISLPIYQNLGLLKLKKYKDYLFLPIRDASAPKETYGAGRYLELNKPKGSTMILDLNTLFNPYCALSNRYNCPITPKANWINVRIEAGEKLPATRINH